ncbi:unnamed protein product [Malus baccata var. baccata]
MICLSQLLTVKLDRNNCPLQKSQFIPLLVSRGLLPFVDGSSQCPHALITDDEGNLTPNLTHGFNKTKKIPQEQYASSHNRVLQHRGELMNLGLASSAKFPSSLVINGGGH